MDASLTDLSLWCNLFYRISNFLFYDSTRDDPRFPLFARTLGCSMRGTCVGSPQLVKLLNKQKVVHICMRKPDSDRCCNCFMIVSCLYNFDTDPQIKVYSRIAPALVRVLTICRFRALYLFVGYALRAKSRRMYVLRTFCVRAGTVPSTGVRRLQHVACGKMLLSPTMDKVRTYVHTVRTSIPYVSIQQHTAWFQPAPSTSSCVLIIWLYFSIKFISLSFSFSLPQSKNNLLGC